MWVKNHLHYSPASVSTGASSQQETCSPASAYVKHAGNNAGALRYIGCFSMSRILGIGNPSTLVLLDPPLNIIYKTSIAAEEQQTF